MNIKSTIQRLVSFFFYPFLYFSRKFYKKNSLVAKLKVILFSVVLLFTWLIMHITTIVVLSWTVNEDIGQYLFIIYPTVALLILVIWYIFNYNTVKKYNSFIVCSLVVFALIYITGRQNAISRIKPYNQAILLINKAEKEVKPKLKNINLTPAEYIKLEQEYLSYYREASLLNLENYPILKGFIQEKYALHSEVIGVDKSLLLENKKYSDEEMKNITESFLQKDKDIYSRFRTYSRREGWMDFFLLP